MSCVRLGPKRSINPYRIKYMKIFIRVHAGERKMKR